MSLTARRRARRLTAAIDTIDAYRAAHNLDEERALRQTEDPPGCVTLEIDGHCVTYATLAGALIELAAQIEAA